jgi:hypothetical protein
MKLSMTQIILGVLIVFAACYIVGWMIFEVPSLLTMPVPDDAGVMINTNVLPEHEILFTTARYASVLLLCLGLTVLVTGTIQRVKAAERQKILAITQLVAGVLVAAASIFVSRWGYPSVFTVPMPEGSNLLQFVEINPGPPMVYASFLTALTFLLGLAVLGGSIAQLIKSRKTTKV